MLGGRSTVPAWVLDWYAMLSSHLGFSRRSKKPGPAKAYGCNTRKTSAATAAATSPPIIMRQRLPFNHSRLTASMVRPRR